MDVPVRRTVQYRLSKLVEAGLLKREGTTKQSKYFIVKDLEKEQLKSEEVIVTSFIIPLTKNSQELKKNYQSLSDT